MEIDKNKMWLLIGIGIFIVFIGFLVWNSWGGKEAMAGMGAHDNVVELKCNDGKDNDGDGVYDCADSDCDKKNCAANARCDFSHKTCDCNSGYKKNQGETCVLSAVCGNYVKEIGENCNSCLVDVPCALGESCVGGSCVSALVDLCNASALNNTQVGKITDSPQSICVQAMVKAGLDKLDTNIINATCVGVYKSVPLIKLGSEIFYYGSKYSSPVYASASKKWQDVCEDYIIQFKKINVGNSLIFPGYWEEAGQYTSEYIAPKTLNQAEKCIDAGTTKFELFDSSCDTKVENCSTIGDEDQNGKADCKDKACATSYTGNVGMCPIETGDTCTYKEGSTSQILINNIIHRCKIKDASLGGQWFRLLGKDCTSTDQCIPNGICENSKCVGIEEASCASGELCASGYICDSVTLTCTKVNLSEEVSLSSCGTPSSGWQSGKAYKLTVDVTQSTIESDCFMINTNNLVLDCNNHKITGPGIIGVSTTNFAGVRLSSVKEVTLKNCVISGFGMGVQIYGSENNNLLNNILEGNNDGIVITNSATKSNVLTGNKACGNTESDLECSVYAINADISGIDNTFSKVQSCVKGWPVVVINYQECAASAVALGDVNGDGCLTEAEFNDFIYDWINNINDIQNTVTDATFNDYQYNYINNIEAIQCKS